MQKSFALSIAALLTACSGSGNSGLSLSARAGAVSTAASSAPASTGISVSRIRVALREIELRTVDDQKRAEIEVGPVLVDLGAADLTGATVRKVLDASVPAGTYQKLEFKIHPLASANGNAAAADLVSAGASILIDGTFNGAPFHFPSSLEAEQEIEGSFVIDAQSQNITLNFDPSGWFLAADGVTVLDPTSAEDHAAIEANIARSLAAFEDDDGSGHENHHGHDDGGDHR